MDRGEFRRNLLPAPFDPLRIDHVKQPADLVGIDANLRSERAAADHASGEVVRQIEADDAAEAVAAEKGPIDAGPIEAPDQVFADLRYDQAVGFGAAAMPEHVEAPAVEPRPQRPCERRKL